MKIVTSWDDGTKDDMKIAKLLKKYELPGIFYFPVYAELANERKHKTRLSLDDLERADIASEFEIGSHTLTHPLLTRIKPHIARSEITNSRLMLQNEFKQEIDSFCYPRGYANPELQIMVKEAGYTNARSTVVGYLHESENPFFTQTTVHVGCDRKEYAGRTWLQYAKDMLTLAVRNKNSVYHLFGHSWEITKNDGWHDLETLFEEIKKHE